MPYLDDVGAWSTGTGDTVEERRANSFLQMMQRLDLVLERLEWSGLSCKASKCRLFAISAEYLGHVVSREGLRMDPKKITSVSEVDPTSICTLEKVRSFLGLCSYYRRFIRHFPEIASPLHDLTKKGVDVPTLSQQPTCQAAIKGLITAITSEPVLATPRFDRRFYVKTDAASTEGIGGVLAQRDDDGHEHVIAYYGRRLTSAERHWTVTEIELLAAKESIKQWRPYLWGREFTLIVDHAALRWLHTMKDTVEGGPASRLMRWILMLNEYRFNVEHKPGAKHCDADGVSRIVSAVFAKQSAPKRPRRAVPTARRRHLKEREQRLHGQTRATVIESYLGTEAPQRDTFLEGQLQDDECRELREALVYDRYGSVNNSDELRHARWLLRESTRLEMHDDLLYRRVGPQSTAGDGDPTDMTDMRLYVPLSLRVPLLHAFHDCLGHVGAQRLARLLRQRYYWPGLHADAVSHVRECHECTLSKPPFRTATTAVGPTIGSYPFDLLYCDVLSVTPTHDYCASDVPGVPGTGYDKLIVFADSLTRWVEAVPCHGSPTSEQVLDILMTHVISRHGTPRCIRSDAGSNLASDLTGLILQKTGVDLRPSPAEHHESVGLVERFQQTLVRMARTSDEGGQFWVDHLPFLLMSTRASVSASTGVSPAALLYGRELRLPAQIGEPMPPATESQFKLPSHLYALRLHNRLTYAWLAANAATREAQERAKSDTEQTSDVKLEFKVDDEVCRRLPDLANKMLYPWAGPYRISEVVSPGRYRLRDLENNVMNDEFALQNLRPYRTLRDAEQLQPDEYLVDELLQARTVQGRIQYQVKWRQYPRSAATWEPRAELLRRCRTLVDEYDAAHPSPHTSHRTSRSNGTSRSSIPPTETDPTANGTNGAAASPDMIEPLSSPADTVPEAATSAKRPPAFKKHRAAMGTGTLPEETRTSDDLPSVATLRRNKWSYGRRVATSRGYNLRMFEPKAFTPTELRSEYFASLRASALDELRRTNSKAADAYDLFTQRRERHALP